MMFFRKGTWNGLPTSSGIQGSLTRVRKVDGQNINCESFNYLYTVESLIMVILGENGMMKVICVYVTIYPPKKLYN